MKKNVKNMHNIVLFTMRNGKELPDVVQYVVRIINHKNTKCDISHTEMMTSYNNIQFLYSKITVIKRDSIIDLLK
jgi:hypothetical protein